MAIFKKKPSSAGFQRCLCGLPSAIAIVLLAAVTAVAQEKPTSGRQLPHTPWGDPDLQGIWSIATITPFERPSALAGKAQLTEQEAAEAEKTFLATQNQDRRDGAGTDADVALAYNDFWWDRGNESRRQRVRRRSSSIRPTDVCRR